MENRLAWTIPIILDISPSVGISEGREIALSYDGGPIAILHVEEIYDYDKGKFAEEIEFGKYQFEDAD